MNWQYDRPRESAVPEATEPAQLSVRSESRSTSTGTNRTAPIEFLRARGVPGQRDNIAPLQAKRLLRDQVGRPAMARGLGAVSQMRMMPGQVIQMDTEIQHQTGSLNLGSLGSFTVGIGMSATLDPDDPVQGSATGPNWVWMQKLRAVYPHAGVVRGHLLNHDLGGYAVPENLYPISTKANADHSARVEQNVKKALTDAHAVTTTPKPKISYGVKVKEIANAPEKAQFHCAWTDETGKAYKDIIDSDLGNDAGGFGGKGPNTSPVAWQHGKRRGEMDWATMIAAKNPKIKIGGTTGSVGAVDKFSQMFIDTVLASIDTDADADDLEQLAWPLSRMNVEKWIPFLIKQGFNAKPKA